MISVRGVDLSAVFDALDDEIVVVDAAGKIVAANAVWFRFAEEGGSRETGGFIGWNYFDVCGATDEGGAAVARALRRALDEGVASRVEYSCPGPDDPGRWFEVAVTPLTGDAASHVVLRHRNVTHRRAAIEDASQSRHRSELLSALVETSSDAIMSYDLDGRIRTWNAGAQRLYGYTPEQAIGQSMEILYPAGFAKRILQYRDEIIAGTLSSFEVTRMTKSGRERLVWVTAAPVRNAHGTVIAISNIHRDITEARRHQESRQLVAQEVIHRAKNMLTVISAIHRRTAATATSMEEFNEKFGERITSLSRSADFLTSEDWSTVPLASLVRSQLALFARDDAPLTIGGPEVELKPQAVKTIGMALHELGTNATKYGALGDAGGAVAINWQIESQDGDPVLRFEWIETGQAFAGAPQHRGFGNTVLTRLAVSLLDAHVDYRFDAGGIRWRIEIPASHFVAEENHSAGAKD